MSETRAVTENESSRAVTWLFNPFHCIAGGQALAAGLAIILVTGAVGAVSRTHFDGVLDMHTGMPADQLKTVWEGLPADAGAFREQVKTRYERAQGYDVVFVTCAFEKKTYDIQVTLDDQQQVSGLFVRPGSA